MVLNKLRDVRRVHIARGIPDGEYPGTRTGVEVRFEAMGGVYEARSKRAVKGNNVPCTIVVSNNEIYVERKVDS